MTNAYIQDLEQTAKQLRDDAAIWDRFELDCKAAFYRWRAANVDKLIEEEKAKLATVKPARKFFKAHKVGGIWFVRVGSYQFTFCKTRKG